MDSFLERVYDNERKRVINGLSFKKKKVLRVMPIPKSGGWMPRNSEGDVLKNRAKVRFTVPYNTRSKMYLDPLGHLTEEQKDELAKGLGLKGKDDLNPLKPGDDNYWKNREVIVDGNGLVLETDNLAHYIDACILLTNYEHIAPSWGSRKDKATYLYAIVDSEAENKEKKQKSQNTMKAFNLFKDIEKSTDKLESVVWIRYWEKKDYPQPPDRPNHDWLFTQVFEMMQTSPDEFIEIVGDEKFEIKANVVKGLKYGALKRKGQKIMFAGADTPIGFFGETVEYLASDDNADDYAKLVDQIDKKEKSKKK